MFISEDIVGKGFLKLVDVVEELKEVEEKDNLFAEFPIGATIQDGGKRKRSNAHVNTVVVVVVYSYFLYCNKQTSTKTQ